MEEDQRHYRASAQTRAARSERRQTCFCAVSPHQSAYYQRDAKVKGQPCSEAPSSKPGDDNSRATSIHHAINRHHGERRIYFACLGARAYRPVSEEESEGSRESEDGRKRRKNAHQHAGKRRAQEKGQEKKENGMFNEGNTAYHYTKESKSEKKISEICVKKKKENIVSTCVKRACL